MSGLDTLLRRAFERRAALPAAGTSAFRAVNAGADGLEDVTVDWFDGVAAMSLYRAFEPRDETRMGEAIVRALGARAVYLKRRPREARVAANVAKQEVAPPEPLAGAPVEAVDVRENGLTFRIRPGDGLAVGLYLDMRDVRAKVRERARGLTVLNLFAYTCGFGVYARAGGAARCVNLDLSRRVLDWGEENLSLNGFSVERSDQISGDAFDWLRRFAKKGEAFDVVILDPPSFSTSRAGAFSVRRDYSKLVAAAAPVVASGGTLYACCNLEALGEGAFDRWIEEGLGRSGRRGRIAARLGPSPIDFPAHRDEPPALKVRVVELG